MNMLFKRVASIAIVSIIAMAMVIPAFAFGSTIPNGNYVYYKYWNFGGTSNYNEIKQMYINDYGIMTPGSTTRMDFNSAGKFEGSIKFTTRASIPSSIATPPTISSSYKVLKYTGFLTWTPIVFSNHSDSKTLCTSHRINTSPGSSTYNAAPVNSLNSLTSGDYQIDVTATYVAPIFQDYVTMFFECGVSRT